MRFWERFSMQLRLRQLVTRSSEIQHWLLMPLLLEDQRVAVSSGPFATYAGLNVFCRFSGCNRHWFYTMF
jgi:hypothetical protein